MGGINYRYDIDTAGGGWYLYEMDIVPEYIAPLKSNLRGEAKHGWGIYDRDGRMSEFRIGVSRWDPRRAGFVDGYIIDESHDMYFPGHVGEKEYLFEDSHRWPCFVIHPQVVVGMMLMEEFGERASLGHGEDEDYMHMKNNDRLADLGFKLRLPSLSFAVDYMVNNDLPSDHYQEIANRLVESANAKREEGIKYGNLGWDFQGDVLQYDRRMRDVTPVTEALDRLALRAQQGSRF